MHVLQFAEFPFVKSRFGMICFVSREGCTLQSALTGGIGAFLVEHDFK